MTLGKRTLRMKELQQISQKKKSQPNRKLFEIQILLNQLPPKEIRLLKLHSDIVVIDFVEKSLCIFLGQ